MGAFSIWHWLIVLAVVVVLFGGSGKISRLMADVAKGINAFKKGLEEGRTTSEGQPLPVKSQTPCATHVEGVNPPREEPEKVPASK